MASDGALAAAAALVQAAVKGAVEAKAPRRTVAATGAASVSAALAALLGADGTRDSVALHPAAVKRRRKRKKKRGSKETRDDDDDVSMLQGGDNGKSGWLPSDSEENRSDQNAEDVDGDDSGHVDGDDVIPGTPITQRPTPSAVAGGVGVTQQRSAVAKGGWEKKGGYSSDSKGRGLYDEVPRNDEENAWPKDSDAKLWHKQKGRGQRRRS